MAATAAAAVGSAFSTSMKSLNCTTLSKTSDPFVRLASTRISQLLSISHTHLAIELLPIAGVSNKLPRMPRISAAVAQEEAAVTVEAQEESEVKEEAEEVASGGEEGSEVLSTKLYIGNVPYHCDSAQLAGIIQEYGTPELIEVLYNKDTGRSRGFAFVTMSSIEDCKNVIENLDGSDYAGRILRVNFADKPKPRVPLYPETEYKLFIGNLSWSVTSETLTELFQEYGNVVGARVIFDGETGRSRGFGFVCYATQSEMEQALEACNGMEIDGRAIRVDLASGSRQ